jgi:hypothetical protein
MLVGADLASDGTMIRIMPLASCVALSALLADAGCVDSHVPEAGSSVFTAEVRKVTLDNRGGGYGPHSPPGAACDIQKATYTVTIEDHLLAWQYCAGSDGSYAPVVGDRTLSDTEWSQLVPALRGLIVADGSLCGADLPVRALIVTTTTDLEYGDAFYGCQIHDRPLIATDGLSAFESAARDLARK